MDSSSSFLKTISSFFKFLGIPGFQLCQHHLFAWAGNKNWQRSRRWEQRWYKVSRFWKLIQELRCPLACLSLRKHSAVGLWPIYNVVLCHAQVLSLVNQGVSHDSLSLYGGVVDKAPRIKKRIKNIILSNHTKDVFLHKVIAIAFDKFLCCNSDWSMAWYLLQKRMTEWQQHLWGARGRRFKSSHPDSFIQVSYDKAIALGLLSKIDHVPGMWQVTHKQNNVNGTFLWVISTHLAYGQACIPELVKSRLWRPLVVSPHINVLRLYKRRLDRSPRFQYERQFPVLEVALNDF